MASEKKPNKGASIADKQYIAKILFTKEQLDQKIVAQRVGVSEKTMSKWVNDFGWKNLRRRLMVSKEEQLNNFYMQLEEMNLAISQREEGKRFGNSKEYDSLNKLTVCIRNMELDLNLADKMEAGKQFIRFAQKIYPHEFILQIIEAWDEFIQVNRK